MSQPANIDIEQERIETINAIAQISSTARQYIESGRAIDDSPDNDERNISTTELLNNVVDILLGELEQLGIRFNEPIEEMIGDLYRIQLLVAARRVFDGDLFWGMLKIVSEDTRRSIFTHVDNVLGGDVDPGEMIQLIIYVTSDSLTLSNEWQLLRDNLRLFASTHRLAEHLQRVISRYVPEPPVGADVVAEVTKVIERMDIQSKRFAFALGMLNGAFGNLVTADEIIVLIRDYARGVPELVTSVGITAPGVNHLRAQIPYHFDYYSSRKLFLTRKAIVLISAAIYASMPYGNYDKMIPELGRTYQLNYETQKLFIEMLNTLPKPSDSFRLSEEM
jgi:hypothetical protein